MHFSDILHRPWKVLRDGRSLESNQSRRVPMISNHMLSSSSTFLHSGLRSRNRPNRATATRTSVSSPQSGCGSVRTRTNNNTSELFSALRFSYYQASFRGTLLSNFYPEPLPPKPSKAPKGLCRSISITRHHQPSSCLHTHRSTLPNGRKMVLSWARHSHQSSKKSLRHHRSKMAKYSFKHSIYHLTQPCVAG